MQSAACGVRGMSTTDSRIAAVSSTAPAAVTHERCGFGERKNVSDPYDVCVSCTSVNHAIHDSQKLSSSVRKPVMYALRIITSGVGGVPARIARSVTAISRLENAL